MTGEGPTKVVAVRGEEEYAADDPVAVLGLIKLIEERSGEWGVSDEEVQEVLSKYQME